VILQIVICEQFETEITAQMKYILALLDEHDLVEADVRMRSLFEQIKITSPEPGRERRLIDLRIRLRRGLHHVNRGAPFTAVIRFRKALAVWQSDHK
jgi:hypothetical protein